MAETQKPLSERDFQQTLRKSFNDVDATLSVGGFLTGKVGHKITMITDPLDSTKQIITFSDGLVLLYQYTLTFTDSSQQTLMSAERTA